MEVPKEVEENRKTEYDIHPLILSRWSPRAMTGEEITKRELMQLFEAAKWAPSSFNAQPWRFIYAIRGTEHWEKFFDLLFEHNKSWAKNATVLVVVVSRKTFEYNDKPSITHTFDSGAAWENLALQASYQGLVTHGMEGFDYEKAKKVLDIPEVYEVHAMIAIGKRAPKEILQEQLREREKPNTRKSLAEIIMEGRFKQ